MPHRVAWAGRQPTVLAELRERGESTEMLDEASPYFPTRRRQLQDAERWCAERGISFARSVRGCRDPSPQEIAAGNTRGAGPLWQRRLEDESGRS